ncbi:OTU domain-containing protein 5-like isoform X1 [Gossypium australe]|uniref:OTU domain-containing protein 5-like isoform X1 n=1 Tax=Gossypium australe TaxID=47621 RepID=A0A5B6UMP4_9ROSI|nr:OTU domain-containing protein 5-like isoform X1 [Gossypium australe]
MHVERASGASNAVGDIWCMLDDRGEHREVKAAKVEGSKEQVVSSGMELVIEAYSILGDDVESMVCYLLETGAKARQHSSKKLYLPCIK